MTPSTKKILKWTEIGSKNFNTLMQSGYTPIGLVLHDDNTGKRATIDFNGYVQYWMTDNIGKMIGVKILDIKSFHKSIII